MLRISLFYLINWIFAAETIQGRKLFKGGNYLRKYVIIVQTEIFNLYVHSLFSYGVVNSTIWICTWQSKLRLIIALSGIIWMLKKRDWTFWTRLMVCQWWVFWNVAKKSTLEINDTLLTIVQWVVPALTVKLECSILG